MILIPTLKNVMFLFGCNHMVVISKNFLKNIKRKFHIFNEVPRLIQLGHVVQLVADVINIHGHIRIFNSMREIIEMNEK